MAINDLKTYPGDLVGHVEERCIKQGNVFCEKMTAPDICLQQQISYQISKANFVGEQSTVTGVSEANKTYRADSLAIWVINTAHVKP